RDAEFLEPRQVVQDRRSRRNRIAAEEHRQLGKLGAGDEAKADALRAGDRAIEPRVTLDGRDRDLLKRSGNLRRFAVGMASVERGDVRIGDLRLGLELGL